MQYFEQMKSILAPLGLDKHNDFTIDQDSLRTFDTPRARWLWIVDAYGTHLVRLGVDEKESSWGKAALRNSSAKPYLLAEGRVRPISADVANTMADQLDFRVLDNTVMRGKHAIADVLTDWKPPTYRDSQYRVTVTFLSTGDLSLDDLVALRYLAIGQAVKKTGTFFCRVEEILVDNHKLMDLIQARRDALCLTFADAMAA